MNLFVFNFLVLPHKKKIGDVIESITLETFKTENKLLLKGQTYLFPCLHLKFDSNYRACLSPKSSIGRIDVLVRAIFDGLGLYDTIPYSFATTGEVWLEVSPQSFNIRINKGTCLTQMMVFQKEESIIPQMSTKSLIKGYDIVFDKKRNKRTRKQFHREKLILSLDVSIYFLVNGLAFRYFTWFSSFSYKRCDRSFKDKGTQCFSIFSTNKAKEKFCRTNNPGERSILHSVNKRKNQYTNMFFSRNGTFFSKHR